MRKLTVGLAQAPQTGDMDVNLSKALEYMDLAAEQGVDLLCFPETHLQGYRVGVIEPDDPVDESGLERAIDTLRDRCRSHGMGVIMGTETPNSGAKPFNSAHVIGDDGETIAVHHKARITALDARGYSCGPGPTPFTFRDVPMGLVICYEGYRFPENTRKLARDGARVVFHPQCSTTLPNMEWKTPVLEALIVARAAETTMYFISTNLSGPYCNARSMVVEPGGIITAAANLKEEMLVTTEIDPDLATLAFLEDDPDKIFKASGEFDAIHGGRS